VLILGASGLLGNAMFRVLSEASSTAVYGAIRDARTRDFFTPALAARLVVVDDLLDRSRLRELFDRVQPGVVINCVAPGRPAPADPLRSIEIYGLLPQLLSHLCKASGARLVQISSDGVFSGRRGGYVETDLPDAADLYGTAKVLGEVHESHAITLRTSIIGPELQGEAGLLEWFLRQKDQCRCYSRAIFSGFPTVVLGRIVRDVVLPRPELSGIYHVASHPISKFDLLALVAREYGKQIELLPDERVVMDRSLNAARFAAATGYQPAQWPALVHEMYEYRFGLARQ
jgi:dTDP-4-dehydrorhamnose reductase